MADRTERGQDGLSIRLLGGFRIAMSGRDLGEVQWASRKASSLVKLLALAPGHRLHREQVMDALWPDLGRQAAAGNLRKALHFARHALDASAAPSSHPYLQSRDDFLLLCSPGDLWVDIDAFRDAAGRARRSADPEIVSQALALYAGDLLPEDPYEQWTIAPREELRDTCLLLLAEAARLSEASGDFDAGIESLRRVLQLEPLNEDAYAGLMRLYALSGQSSQALRLYRQLAEALRRELDAEPQEAIKLLRAEIEAGRFPVAANGPRPARVTRPQPPRRRHNLPAQLTSFVGRKRELAELARLLSTARLLTLTGAGGSGKTRLAIELAGGLVEDYPDGVWFVELDGLSGGEAPVVDPQPPSQPSSIIHRPSSAPNLANWLVPQAMASALGVRDQPGRPLLETLAEYLQARQLLLVLDNCEHVVAACAEVAETLLRAGPGLKILATSREALNIPGEVTWLVPSLSMPALLASAGWTPGGARDGDRVLASPEELEGYEAVQLFAERASSVSPAFTLGEHNAAAVAQICRRLDGIPLAIELAAARVRVLSAEQIVERLDDAFHLLVAGSRTALPRHQTLKATIDWSYDLLAPEERLLFDRLSVFAGGFTIDAVEAVCAGGSIEPHQALGILARLIDKSLVLASETEPNGAARYRLLETLRQYGRERLAERGETAQAQSLHAHYYATLCAHADPQLNGPAQVEWLETLNVDLDNLRAALDWSLAHDPQTGLLIAGTNPRFWETRGYLAEARRRLDTLLAVALSPTVLRAKALFASGYFASRDGDNLAGARLLEDSLAIYTELGDQTGIALALERLGITTATMGNIELAATYLERSISLLKRIGYKAGLGWALGSLGMYARIAGDYDRARDALNESLALTREIGDLHTTAYTLNHLGQLYRVHGDYDTAWRLLEECLEMSYTMKSKAMICWTLECLSTVGRMRGDYETARETLLGGLEVAREIGAHRTLVACLASFAVLAVHYGSNLDAVRLFGAAMALAPYIREAMDADELAEWDTAYENAQAALTTQAFAQARAEGQSLTWDQATNLAGRVGREA